MFFCSCPSSEITRESEIHPNQTDKPPPNVYVVGGSTVFHKYMYILYLLFKANDKSRGGRGLVMLQKQHDKSRAMLECDREERGRCNLAERDRDREKVGASLYAY